MNCKISKAKSNYRKIGDFIQQVNIKNDDGSIKLLLGVNLDKKFIPSVANTIGTDMTKYKVIKKGQFGCKLMSVGRDKKLPISRLINNEKAIISSAYYVFEVIDENILSPEYLMMWFQRPESDRYLWFQSGGDIRGRITWDDLCQLPIKIPSIEKQHEIVKEYNTVANRITLNETI
ncbi:restriction endonuclease subunit S [Tenacibaculum finnmarkense]|nr:restriction endonuclease subunit S [Tenacibaculum finnmarkense]MCG8795923.1 restriction endonuclease subunit S [Tenacibaculum finnmarkense]MCG8798086.1 restriction endonuclease subunit S [Tenacibaculum finnmarkense]